MFHLAPSETLLKTILHLLANYGLSSLFSVQPTHHSSRRRQCLGKVETVRFHIHILKHWGTGLTLGFWVGLRWSWGPVLHVGPACVAPIAAVSAAGMWQSSLEGLWPGDCSGGVLGPERCSATDFL